MDDITEATPCMLHVPVNKWDFTVEAAMGQAILGRAFHNQDIPVGYTKVQVDSVQPLLMKYKLDISTTKDIEILEEVVGNFISASSVCASESFTWASESPYHGYPIWKDSNISGEEVASVLQSKYIIRSGISSEGQSRERDRQNIKYPSVGFLAYTRCYWEIWEWQAISAIVELQEGPWEMRRFHEWYMRACCAGFSLITASVPANVFLSEDSYLMVDFRDMNALFCREKLDINIISVWWVHTIYPYVHISTNICYRS